MGETAWIETQEEHEEGSKQCAHLTAKKVGTPVETESERTCTRHLPEDEIYCRNFPIWKNAYTQALPPLDLYS